MTTLKLSRYTATGNTFLAWDAIEQPVPQTIRPQLARLFCDGYPGFKTDGIFFIEAAKEESKSNLNTSRDNTKIDFCWDFYNSDGSSAEMCGNAARAAFLFWQKKFPDCKSINFLSNVGVIGVTSGAEDQARVILPALKQPGEFKTLKIGGKNIEHFFINTGVPHLVIEGEPNLEVAKYWRKAPEFGAAGTNVTFIIENSPGEVTAVTFERGVEDFTLACGTGAVAAGFFSKEKNPFLKRHVVEMPGGNLIVDLSEREPKLEAEVHFEFDLHIPDDSFKIDQPRIET